MLEAEADIGIRGQVKNEIAARHRADEPWQIQQIAAFQAEARSFGGFFQELDLAGREVIETDHGMTGAEKRISQTTAYETGRARDKCSQNNSFRIGRSVFADSRDHARCTASCKSSPY
jgi:hypothetical protein